MSTPGDESSEHHGGARAVDVVRLHCELAACRRALGPDHPDALRLSDSLAHALEDAGRLGEAITGLELTLAARRRVLGDDHPDTLRSVDDVVRCYRAAGRPDQADAVEQAAQAIRPQQEATRGRGRTDAGGEKID